MLCFAANIGIVDKKSRVYSKLATGEKQQSQQADLYLCVCFLELGEAAVPSLLI